MLSKFAVKNYRGFAERIEWDLSSPANYEFNSSAIQNNIVKNGIIYGPNGSGKTNFSLALFDIVNHLTQKHKKEEYYNNFANAKNYNQLVEFEYTFKFSGQEVYYAYAKNRDGKLINEALCVDSIVVFERKAQKLQIDTRVFPLDEKVQSNLANNVNSISIVNFLLSSYPLSSDSYLIKLKNFVDEMLWFRSLGQNEFIGFETNIYLLEEYIIKEKLVNDFQAFLQQTSGQSFYFIQPKKGDKALKCSFGNNNILFHTIVSTGTQSLILLYVWLQQLDKATFVFVDEFDAFYHYALSYEVCKRLFEQKCQVFLSSHNTYLMTNDLLRPDCNFILNNNVIKPLCDCTKKELRFANNIEKLYRGGTFAV